jgi:hypothetical protein
MENRKGEPRSLGGLRSDPSTFDPDAVYEWDSSIGARRAAYEEYMAAMRREIAGRRKTRTNERGWGRDRTGLQPCLSRLRRSPCADAAKVIEV